MIVFSNALYEEPVERTAARARKAGFDGLELRLEPRDDTAERAARALAEHGLRCASGVAVMSEGRDLTHPDRHVREAATSYLNAILDWTARLGGRAVTLFPASHGRFEPFDDAERDRCVEALGPSAKRAEELGVRIALEPVCRFETHFINRVEQAAELAARCGPAVGVVPDTFHMNIEEADWESALRAARQSLVNIHVADNNRQPPGYGTFPWRRLGQLLAEIDFQGDIVAEFPPPAAGGSPVDESTYARWISDAATTMRLELGRGSVNSDLT